MNKSVIYVFAALAVLASCQQQNISLPVDFNVTLDEDNVYRPGEIVRFRFEGDADYITFFSGEPGHEFVNRDRTSIPMEQVRGVSMDMQIQPLWGSGAPSMNTHNGFHVYISKEFKGLESEDGLEQREELRRMTEEGMFPLDYEDDSKPWKLIWNDVDLEGTPYDWKYGWEGDLKDYAENFAIAFHWKPYTLNLTRNQRTYHVKGNIKMDFDKDQSVSTAFAAIPFNIVTMNEQDPPHLGEIPKQRGDSTAIGTVNFGKPDYDINFEGAASNYPGLDWELDVWCFSDPMKLNSVSSDTGVQIKSMLNPIITYDHIYEKPGTYKAVFYGVNDNYQGTKTAYREVTVIVVDDPPFSE
ncbi:MAG: DUF5017 domain-containing protein [Candidatus Cryptobacteroides sp.]